eukprot:m.363054 g.363054  ORF g.363054 m.363054 type:complete len:244 (-) comp21397_c0_seq1:132-863(-)
MARVSSSMWWLALACLVVYAAADSHDHDDHDDHDHHDHEACGCIAAEYGFEINCLNDTLLATSTEYLQNHTECSSAKQGCAADTNCQFHYYVIQAHHDFCLDIGEAIGELIHDYESGCQDCLIARQYDPSLESCPKAKCSKTSVSTAALNDLEEVSNNCASDCSSTVCASAFRIIRAVHDTCDEDEIPEKVEDAIHDYEEQCQAFSCNIATEEFDPNVCSSASAASASIAVIWAVAAVVFLFV